MDIRNSTFHLEIQLKINRMYMSKMGLKTLQYVKKKNLGNFPFRSLGELRMLLGAAHRPYYGYGRRV